MNALKNMAATMQATATALGDHPGNRNGGNGGNGPMTLATFMKINPLVFRGTTNRTEADNWFKAMEQALQVQQVLAEHVWSLPLTRWWVKLSIGSWKPDAYYSKTMLRYPGMSFRLNFIRNISPIQLRRPRSSSYCS
ncbi:hypothetical protein AHAS_Ahas15G0247200 [Arachis hypogaea]